LGKGVNFPRNTKWLEDGTILYRHSKSQPTVRLNEKQLSAINTARQKELAAALIPAIPLLGVIIAMVGGYAAVLWPYALGLFLVYGTVNYAIHQRVTAKIDIVLSQAPQVAKSDELILQDFMMAAQEIAKGLSNLKLAWIFFLCFVYLCVAVLFLLSIFVEFGISELSKIAWPLKLFVGISGGPIVGSVCYIAALETKRRLTKGVVDSE
jgi:hypothetical protein